MPFIWAVLLGRFSRPRYPRPYTRGHTFYKILRLLGLNTCTDGKFFVGRWRQSLK